MGHTTAPSDALMGRRRNTPDFKRSSRIHRVNLNPSAEEREITKKLIETGRAGAREAYGQKLLNSLCARVRVAPVRLHVHDVNQPHKKHGGRLAYKEYGAYYLDEEVIRIANLTAVRGQTVAGKTFFDTLIHELMHHLDRKLLKIPSTPHSPGFYNRIDDLKRRLMDGDPDAPADENGGGGQWEAPPKGLMAAVERAAREAREAGLKLEAKGAASGLTLGARIPRWPRDRGGLFSTGEDSGEMAAAPAAGRAKSGSGRRDGGGTESGKGAPPRREASAPAGETGENQLTLDFEG